MKKILLIENDKFLRGNLELLLSLSGYTVLTSTDSREVINLAIAENPNLIICDVKMVRQDDYGVFDFLGNHPKTTNIPFIFITGKGDDVNHRREVSLGADDYLARPINTIDLLNTIRTRLAKNEYSKNTSPLKTNNNPEFNLNNGMTRSINLISEEHEVQYYKKKHMLYRVNQRPSALYFVKSGKVTEFMVNEDGKELITGIFSKGDFFGYTEIFKDCNYCKNSKVIEDASLVLVPKEEFLQKINADNLLSIEFIRLLSEKVRESEEIIINMAYNSLRKKVASGITRIINKFHDSRSGRSVINIPREDLSHIVGSSLESMIRTLRDFKNEKLIDIEDDGSIVVLEELKIRQLKN